MTSEELVEKAAELIALETDMDGDAADITYCRDAARAVVALVIEEAARVADGYSNAKPGDICEVMAGDWQAGIAVSIRALAPTEGETE